MPLILHVATRFLGGGTEKTLQDIITALPPPSFRHVLVVGREHEMSMIRTLLGDVEVVAVRSLVRSPHPVRDLRAFVALVRVVRGLRPDVLHTIQSKSGILGRLAGRAGGVRFMVHTVNMANFGPGFHPVLGAVYRGAERLVGRWTSRFPVNGSELRERYLRARIGDASRFRLIRSSVETAEFERTAAEGAASARTGLGLPVDGPIVLFAGSLDRRKGAHELPDYLAALHATGTRAMLVIAGDGPLRPVIQEELHARGLDEFVRFLGYTRRLPDAMAAADCLVMLSHAEGLATVLVHAVATGTPFVSYQVDGPGELIGLGATGAIGPIGDWRRAAELTQSMLGAPRGVRIDLSNWSGERVRASYRAVFEEVLRGEPSTVTPEVGDPDRSDDGHHGSGRR